MKTRTILAFVLVFTLAFSVLTGCGGNEKTSGDAKKTLTVEVFERGNAPSNGETADNNRWTKWINDEFGAKNNIEVKFQPIQRSQEVEMLNVLMASKQAPDIIFTYDRSIYTSFAQQKGLTELSDLIEKHGKQLKSFLGNTLESMELDGKLYGVTSKRAYSGQFISYVRQDWLDRLGMEIPKSPDEVYEMLKAFKANDLDGVGSENVIGMPLTANSFAQEDWQQQTVQMVWAFVEPMSKKDFYTLPQIQYPGYKEGVRFLNKLYNEGLIDPDFAFQNDNKKMDEHIATGRTGFFTRDINVGVNETGCVGTLTKHKPNANYVACAPFNNKNGISPKRLYGATALYIMIPAFSDSAPEAIKYLNWMADSEVGTELMFGVEGEHYKLVEGIPVTIDPEYNKQTKWNTTDLSIIYNGADYGSLENYYTSVRVQDPIFGALREQACRLGVEDGYYDPFYTCVLEKENKYRSTLNKKFQELMIKSIIASPVEFDSVYDGLSAEYMTIGGNEVYEEKCAAYDAGNYVETTGENIYKPYTE